MRRLSSFLIAALMLVAASAAALGGGRVALVIGNSDYAGAGTLANPVNDAEDIAAKLRTIGFTVVDGYNLGKRELEGRIGDFADALDGASAGLFYYAGHGIAVDGRNFIVPTDARLDIPAKLRLEAIPVDDVMDLMRQQTGTAILILDACRNNPFARSLTAKSATRGVQAVEGLAQIDGGKGTFVAFSTAPGAVAMDGTGRNSPFAAALLRHIAEPGQSINDLMISVRRDVVQETKDFQTPMSWDSLTDRFAFVTGPAAPQLPAASATPQPQDSLAADVEALLATYYLRPNPVSLEDDIARMFAADVSSYGRRYSREALVAAKAKWFGKYAKWQMALVPGTLAVARDGDGAAHASFAMRYTYWPKDAARPPVTGTARVRLGLAVENGVWKITSEDSPAE